MKLRAADFKNSRPLSGRWALTRGRPTARAGRTSGTNGSNETPPTGGLRSPHTHAKPSSGSGRLAWGVPVEPSPSPRARDVEKERRLKEFRVVYDFDKWAAHRSTSRYMRHFQGLFVSRIVAGLRLPLLLIALESSFVCAWEAALSNGMLPAGCCSIQVKMPALFSLSSFALSLLLVFKTNQSYARFDEARRLWGMMVNRCRDLSRQAASYFGPGQRDLIQVLCQWLVAYPWVVKNHVREDKMWHGDLDGLLDLDDIDALAASDHPPMLALQVITEILNRAALTEKQRLQFDASVTQLMDMVGACERILRTPIPLSYTRHTARFLVIWLGLLPFNIYQQCGWVTVFSSVVLGFCLLAIDEIAVSLEEPFNILPLEAINATIALTVNQFMQQMDSVMTLVDKRTGTKRQVEYLPEQKVAAPRTQVMAAPG